MNKHYTKHNKHSNRHNKHNKQAPKHNVHSNKHHEHMRLSISGGCMITELSTGTELSGALFGCPGVLWNGMGSYAEPARQWLNEEA